MDYENERHRSDQADRSKIPGEVELQIAIHVACDKELRGQHHPRVTVGRRARDHFGADGAGDAPAGIDDDALAPRLVQALAHDARDDVRARAGRAPDDEADRSFGVACGKRSMGSAQASAQRRRLPRGVFECASLSSSGWSWIPCPAGHTIFKLTRRRAIRRRRSTTGHSAKRAEPDTDRLRRS